MMEENYLHDECEEEKNSGDDLVVSEKDKTKVGDKRGEEERADDTSHRSTYC